MKQVLNQLFEHQHLDKEQAREILIKIAGNEYNTAQVAAFITVFLMRSVSVEELQGFREALLELCIEVDFSDFETIDLCGTGGDGKNTFNISTLASFVVAGAGYKVAKHGNYGVSSVSGSSNVLEYLGLSFTNDQSILNRQLDQANIAFLHAPLFHPAMKTVAPIRRELGVKTFFNMLGPLVNPSQPNNQVIGVFNLELLRIYQYLLQQLDKNYIIIHSLDGYDEISLTGSFKMAGNSGVEIINPADEGFSIYHQDDISGGDSVEDAAKIFMNVLNNDAAEAQKEVVEANAAMAIQCIDADKPFRDCAAQARESIESKNALHAFERILKLNKD